MVSVSGDRAPSGEGDIIFFGGDIVTAAPGPAEPEAVAVKDGIIVFTGGYADALSRWRGPRTQLRDLRGRALLPGFIDARGHLGGIGLQAAIAGLLAEPDGDVSDIAALQEELRAFAASEVGSSLAWIVGFGCEDAMLAEQRHPTREDLDAVSAAKPVLAIHQSFHLGAVNSAGLAESPDDDPVRASQEYEGGVRVAGAKMHLDGSPAGPDGLAHRALHDAAGRPDRGVRPAGHHPVVLLHAHLLLGRLVPRHGPGTRPGGDYLAGPMGSRPADDLHVAPMTPRCPAQFDRHLVQPGHPGHPQRPDPRTRAAGLAPGRGGVHHDQRRPPVLRAGPQGQHRGRQARRPSDPQKNMTERERS
jgi:hypothetical protein